MKARLAITVVTLLALPAPLAAQQMARSDFLEISADRGGQSAIAPNPSRRLLYLNRNGGAFTGSKATEDSFRNLSRVPPEGTTVNVPAWSFGAEKWRLLRTCVEQTFLPFGLDVVEVDPGDVNHIEAVIGGTSTVVGLSPGTGGIAPMKSDCSVLERAIAFTFADDYNGDVLSICWTTTHEIAHTLGLTHTLNLADPMTYLLGGPVPKRFQNEDAQCGESVARDCKCGGQTQNSFEHLRRVLGEGVLDISAPDVVVTSPSRGESLPPGFLIVADGFDDQHILTMDAYIDGTNISSRMSAPWEFIAPLELEAGAHVVEVRGQDWAGNLATASVEVRVTTEGGCNATATNTVAASGSSSALAALFLIALCRRRRR